MNSLRSPFPSEGNVTKNIPSHGLLANYECYTPWRGFDPFESNERLRYAVEWIDIDPEPLGCDLFDFKMFILSNGKDICLDFKLAQDVETPDCIEYLFSTVVTVLPRRFFLPVCAIQYMQITLKPTRTPPGIWPTKVLVGRFEPNPDACLRSYLLPLWDGKDFLRIIDGTALTGRLDEEGSTIMARRYAHQVSPAFARLLDHIKDQISDLMLDDDEELLPNERYFLSNILALKTAPPISDNNKEQ